MGFFSKFEGKMEDAFEGTADKVFDSPLSPIQIAKKAEKQMRREKMLSAGKEYAPTLYTVLVNEQDDKRLFGFYPTLAGEVETRLMATASSEGLTMDGQPLVRFIVDEGLKHGKFDVIAEVVSAPIVSQLREEEMQRYGLSSAPASVERVTDRPAPAQPLQAEVITDRPARPQVQVPQVHQAPQAQPAAQNGPMDAYQLSDDFFADSGYGALPADDLQGFDAYPAADAYAGNGAFEPEPEFQKPPLPYVPEEEIDRSIDYGEYTFDSKNFTDYRQEETQQADDDQENESFYVPSPASNPLYARKNGVNSVPPVADPAQPAQPAHPAQPTRAAAPSEEEYAARGQIFGLPEISLDAPAAPAAPAPQPQPAAYAARPQGRPQINVAQVYPQGNRAANPAPENNAASQQPNRYAPATSAFVGGQAGAPAPRGQQPHARLVNTATNRAYDLATNRILVGRETSNHIVVNDLNTSRHHAEIRLEPQGVWVITDLGSTNGTYVNGQFVTRRGLQDGDRITLGTTDFIFTLR